ncbi:fatty acid hydroxylase family protein [Chitinophaga oryziterrae]|uniref:Fatty acid hydroxylase family protein n=1 Tax=Chitinophaga oryziterrae TaxID=1031224 RepID=A0A6N8JGN6_9BACT|nr:sterol desaturase family protein [Chitinophaga oryziterrae]MVT43519.1 fatty acid hydroxylase family protein [Chitinophaga oryziterrae]
MPSALNYLLHLPVLSLWLIFFFENVMITAMVLLSGRLLHQAPYSYPAREWGICMLTNILNTIVTYAGFWMWKNNIIHIAANISWMIITDFLILFLAMDLFMFIFHYIIHKTFLFKMVHQLHHQSVDPSPIDLFVLHPIETIAFGGLWLILLTLYPFNIYAMIIYLVINVIFGMIGHLGIEPLPGKIRSLPVIKYLGTSTFHHNHHQDVEYNFGFYTSIWDRLLKTYK